MCENYKSLPSDIKTKGITPWYHFTSPQLRCTHPNTGLRRYPAALSVGIRPDLLRFNRATQRRVHILSFTALHQTAALCKTTAGYYSLSLCLQISIYWYYNTYFYNCQLVFLLSYFSEARRKASSFGSFTFSLSVF